MTTRFLRRLSVEDAMILAIHLLGKPTAERDGIPSPPPKGRKGLGSSRLSGLVPATIESGPGRWPALQ